MDAFLLHYSFLGTNHSAIVFANSEKQAIETLQSDGFSEIPEIQSIIKVSDSGIWYLT